MSRHLRNGILNCGWRRYVALRPHLPFIWAGDLIVSSREERDHGNGANVIHDDAYGACPAYVGGCVASAYVRENVYEARLAGRRHCAHDDGVHHARADGRGLWENGSAHVHGVQSCAATLRLPSIHLRSAVAPRPPHQML
jgi:hypothetical protein